jgi:hypothetical protein
MSIREIEHMWKQASNNPNHDTNWHDPVVVKFAALVAAAEREACALIVEDMNSLLSPEIAAAIRARGQA